MFTRIIMLMIIAVLALPVATLTPPTETNQGSGSHSAVAAKGKNHKNTDKKKKKKTDTRTVRQPVTQTFISSGPITIPNGAPGTTKGNADLYPSVIGVSGFTNGVITDVNLVLTNLTHSHASDIDFLLSTGDGRRALVMSDRGVGEQVINLDLTLDDEAAAEVPETDLISGTFRPTNIGSDDDTFAAPAPAPDANVALSTFDGADPNGNWQLWVMDDSFSDHGDIGKWALQITADADVQVPDQTKEKKHKKQGKKRR